MPRSLLQLQTLLAITLALAITTAGFSIYRAYRAPSAETVCFQFHAAK